MRFFGLFEGIGGFRLAAERLGWQSIGYCEKERFALETYRANFKVADGEFFHADAVTLPVETMPYFDVLFAGFPCQPFSMAGKRLGFDDARGTLFYEIVRVLRARQPHCFVLENVANLARHNGKKTITQMLLLLSKTMNGASRLIDGDDCLGYDVHHAILNSSDFGVPQMRNRLFIVGFKNPRQFTWPRPTNNDVSFGSVKEKGIDFTPFLMPKTPSRVKMAKECPILTDSSICATLTTKNDRWRNVGLVPYGDWYRFLTPREMARIQGFPDSFMPHTSYHRAEEQFGNAVTVPVVEAILRAIELA